MAHIQESAHVFTHKATRQFHLTNGLMSYIFAANGAGKLINLYMGAAVPDREDFSYLIELQHRPVSSCPVEGDLTYSLEHLRQEFPEYGTSDYRRPAISIRQTSGSTITDFRYTGYRITEGKPALTGLPATYVDDASEAMTLEVDLLDEPTGVTITLSYSIMRDLPVIARSVRVSNTGKQSVIIERLASLNLDLPDCDYVMTELTGAWARERAIRRQPLHPGTQAIESLRGASGHFANPVAAFARPNTTESTGEVIGMGLVYSGSYAISAQVDSYDVARLQAGFDDLTFRWHLDVHETFQSPETVLVYTPNGYDGMSQAFHRLVLRHLVRGPWRDRERPILINNWEATYFDFNEEKLVRIASKAKDVGVELFVLDDGWFGERNDDTAGLGDWTPNKERLPDGLGRLSRRINDLGMKFGLWFEPEMVNKESDLYQTHPDWVIHTPGRHESHGRNQYVLNFANSQVVDAIYDQMYRLLSGANISYIKWDMNRNITEAYDITRGAEHQGELLHRYILGVYELHERLLQVFPNLIIEGCASGGGRFDLGMLYYVQQIWASDDSDAVERMRIQYGTSLFYPLASMGAHVSIVPNHQTGRVTPIATRANVAMFGTFGFELDLAQLTEQEYAQVEDQTAFFKRYRKLIHTGSFHRLISPFEADRDKAAWMVVAEDRRTAIVADYRILTHPNTAYTRLYPRGLNPDMPYHVSCTGPSTIDGGTFTGAELMNVGLMSSDASAGQPGDGNPLGSTADFTSRLFVLEAID